MSEVDRAIRKIQRYIRRAIRHFQKGMISGVSGFVYAYLIEAFAVTLLGPYIPPFLISGGMFVWGVLTDAQTLADQDHWFVFGVVFISFFIDRVSLVLGVICLIVGLALRKYLEHMGYHIPRIHIPDF